jgi:acetyl esterase
MRTVVRLTILLLPVISILSCGKMYENTDPYINIRPNGAKPSWAPTITPQMQKVIEKLDSFNLPPLYTLTPQQARQQPSMSDIVSAVMQEYGITYSPMYIYTDTASVSIPVHGTEITGRIYTPRVAQAPYPVILYFHGGTWVTGDINAYHISARALSEQTESIVVSVSYRQAPEHSFPAAHKDAFAAYQWIIKNTAAIRGDAARIAVAGEGVGGQLAAGVSIMSRDSGIKKPVHQLLIYPLVSQNMNTGSYHQYANALPMNKSLLEWSFAHYKPATPWTSIADIDLHQLPPATIIAAELDPLQSEGKLLADKLQAAGVAVNYRLFAGVTHDFFGMAKVLPEARDAQKLAADQLKQAFR